MNSTKRYRVAAVWSNGDHYDCVTKDESTKEAALGSVSLLLREIMPFQIVITDLQYSEPMPNDLQKIADSLNNEEVPA